MRVRARVQKECRGRGVRESEASMRRRLRDMTDADRDDACHRTSSVCCRGWGRQCARVRQAKGKGVCVKKSAYRGCAQIPSLLHV